MAAQDKQTYFTETLAAIFSTGFVLSVAKTIIMALIGTSVSIIASMLLTPLFKKLFKKWKLLK